MSDKKNVELDGEVMIAKAKDFWTKNSKPIIAVCAVIILLGGGWLVYKNFFKAPKEAKANEALFKAEEYFRMDSIQLALNGDGQNMGFLRVISKFGGTEAANLASYYAGSCFIKLDDNEKAVKHLKNFSTTSKPVQARAYKLLGDAYADLGKNSDAISYYKKSARHFEEDKAGSSEALFLAASLAEKIKDTKEAIALYKELKEKFPFTQYGSQADTYLAVLGVYNVN
jgi:tetratricopeptide (TPR) repeat protein